MIIKLKLDYNNNYSLLPIGSYLLSTVYIHVCVYYNYYINEVAGSYTTLGWLSDVVGHGHVMHQLIETPVSYLQPVEIGTSEKDAQRSPTGTTQHHKIPSGN